MASISNSITTQEIELLQTIKRTFKEKKWKLISKTLAKKGFKRSEHECRHKWVNCLNPDINHGPWTEEELMVLYQEYEKNNSQWSIIQKSLPNRTQIKIKNHFYGVLRNILRFVIKYFKSAPGRESEISNRINPNSLQCIYRGDEEYTFMGNIIKNSIVEMGYHLDKQKLLKKIDGNRELFSRLNSQMLKEIGFSVSSIEEHVEDSSSNKATFNPKVESCSIPKNHCEKTQNSESQVNVPFISENHCEAQVQKIEENNEGIHSLPYILCYYPNNEYFCGNQLYNFMYSM